MITFLHKYISILTTYQGIVFHLDDARSQARSAKDPSFRYSLGTVRQDDATSATR